MNRQIIEEASEWFVELNSEPLDQATRSAFDRWLRTSPEHVRVYLELLPIWDDAGVPRPEDQVTVDDLVALARGTQNVVELQPSVRTIRQEVRRRPAVNRRVAIAATFALVVLMGAAGGWFVTSRAPTYATAVGEQRSIRLADGSTVEINTRSRIRVKFSEHERNVELLEGQALFKVAKDSQRPFTVSSGNSRVRAVGTVFDVYRKSSETIVTVLEGRVSVNPRTPPEGTHEDPVLPSVDARPGIKPSQPKVHQLSERDLLLSAGEQITLSAVARTIAPRRTDVAIATAWAQGRLIFEATPLPEVAAEFNRYNDRRIVVEDRALNDFLVNGSFGSTDPSSLLRFLEAQPGIAVHETATMIRITRR